MQPLQRLLLDRFDPHRHDLGTACRFEQGAGIGRVGLVALDVGADVGRRQQSHHDPETVQATGPVVGRATRFHHHQTHRAVDEPALELGAGETMAFNHPPRAIGDGELENGLGEIHTHNRQSSGSIHLGLLLVDR